MKDFLIGMFFGGKIFMCFGLGCFMGCFMGWLLFQFMIFLTRLPNPFLLLFGMN